MERSCYDGGLGLSQLPAGAEQLGRSEAMRLLASVAYGRIVFTFNALPAIRPLNHLVEHGLIILRTRLTSSVAIAAQPANAVVVNYEADNFDPLTQTGWAVVITGQAYTVTDPDQTSHYERSLLPWINHGTDTVLAIEPNIITGFRIATKKP
ncbi:pyridoxamine 5'-phosphate oxidase family protein [Mycobacteroides salmoniphilum]|uniref:pyridoxamine 5'-phosphate oxidase family protein n=1 Tax=Mycobacteroides salmoniphilum TaxID=404941 RepID=UPI0009927D64|nr:pyridoxamine 5'-phosphate oxidase family protein [Mycobacteroides salmoniphilum]